jgi:DNA-directed RNA polymerase subunit RPC12/RpoP
METPALLQFICPRCHATLRVPTKYLGQRGSCKHCSGKIALIGRADATHPQFASLVENEASGPKGPPPTEAQQARLAALRVAPTQIAGMDRRDASDAIANLQQQVGHAEPPSEKQLEYLRKLGASEAMLAAVRSKADASDLIEAMHLRPTLGQIQHLQRLGATGEQIATLRSKGEAESLIQRLQRGG